MEKQTGIDWGKFGMEEAAYKQWWPLHRRAALGEPLSAEEQAHYEAGLRQLEAEELPIQSSIDALRQARQQMLAAQVNESMFDDGWRVCMEVEDDKEDA